jgi:hypothetical protein
LSSAWATKWIWLILGGGISWHKTSRNDTKACMNKKAKLLYWDFSSWAEGSPHSSKRWTKRAASFYWFSGVG